MDQLEISVLGGCEFRLGGQPVAGFVSRKVQALACYVALSERPVPRSVLMELLWGEGNDQAAQTSLRKALSNLGQLLGEHVLISRNDVALSREHAAVDALRFGQLSAAGDLAALRAAVDSYGGDFLEGWGLRDAPQFDDWAAGQRERLRDQLEAALFALGERLAADEESWPESIGLMSRLLQLNPYREDACRHAMALLARSGQRTAALELYERCRQRLDDELGLEPLPETVALSERIQTAAPRAPELPPERTPFVGRPAELAALVGALNAAECRLLTITGAGGMGKTRLALRGAHAIAHHFWDGVWFVNFT
ncbi:MAG TPA: BTAD domain-containing putative transcriptional regulator, partial [Herpetosiphonaceae bacterium]